MGDRFRPVDRNTPYLLPPSIDEWLPADHLARFVVDTVQQLDLSGIEDGYTARGSNAYHPRMMTALLFYSYASGTFSSRKIEAATYEQIPFRFITANQHPDHDSICTFRRRFLEELQELFVQILQIAAEMGMDQIGDVSLDGTKVAANASKHKALSWDRASQLEKQLAEEIEELLWEAEQTDRTEEEDDDSGSSIPEEIQRRKERLDRIKEAKRKIQERAEARHEAKRAEYEQKMKEREVYRRKTGNKKPGSSPKPPQPGPEDKDQVNLTDAESRIMWTSDEGFQQAYNGQAVVDMDTHLILAGHLSQQSTDYEEVPSAVEALEQISRRLDKEGPERLAADGGYYSEANVQTCEEVGLDPHISPNRQAHHQGWRRWIGADEPPEQVPDDAPTNQQMEAKLHTKEGRRFYGRRKATVETVFGILKRAMGFRQFSLRGLRKAAGEWKLLLCAYNLKRMHTLWG